MSIDVTNFKLTNVIDTCAIRNIFSSSLLWNRLKESQSVFFITNMVRYETLIKPTDTTEYSYHIINDRLKCELKSDKSLFVEVNLSIEDIYEIGIKFKNNLGLGEISCLAYAYKNRFSILTDDQRARKIANAYHINQQTSPQLVGWLIYQRLINDTDYKIIIEEHQKLRDKDNIVQHFNKAREIALQACLYQTKTI